MSALTSQNWENTDNPREKPETLSYLYFHNILQEKVKIHLYTYILMVGWHFIFYLLGSFLLEIFGAITISFFIEIIMLPILVLCICL